MNTLIAENERNYPELKALHTVVLNEKETEDRRCWAAFCYTMIALALARKGKNERHLI